MKSEKKAFINKCGYTAGVYGCSNEYFNCVAIDGEKVIAFTFSGLYGEESRVAHALEAKGFKIGYIPLNTWGKLTRKDVLKTITGAMAIDNLDELLTRGYLELDKRHRAEAGLSKLN